MSSKEENSDEKKESAKKSDEFKNENNKKIRENLKQILAVVDIFRLIFK